MIYNTSAHSAIR